MKAVGQARLDLSGVSTPDHLWPPTLYVCVQALCASARPPSAISASPRVPSAHRGPDPRPPGPILPGGAAWLGHLGIGMRPTCPPMACQGAVPQGVPALRHAGGDPPPHVGGADPLGCSGGGGMEPLVATVECLTGPSLVLEIGTTRECTWSVWGARGAVWPTAVLRVLLNNSASPVGGGGSDTPPAPPPLLSDWANFSPGFRPINNFLWRLRRKSV